jgi:hypothetical protein
MQVTQIFLLFFCNVCLLAFRYEGIAFECECRLGMSKSLVLASCNEPRDVMLGRIISEVWR